MKWDFDVCDGNKVYGHSPKVTPCVSVAKFNAKIHFTISLIVGVSGLGVKFV